MAKAHTYNTIDGLFLNSISPKFGNHHHRIVQWLRFSYALLRNALTLVVACRQLNTGFTNPHPTPFQVHKPPKNEMLDTVLYKTQLRPPPTQHVNPPILQPSNEKYPLLIHTQPLIPGQVYIPPVDDHGSALCSPSTTRCSSSTLALRDDDTRKIFTSSPPGLDRMMTPGAVCEKREELMTRELLMMSAHSYSYAAPFYPVNQSGNRDDGNQKHKDPDRPPLLPFPPPLEVAPYRSLERTWKKHFTDGLKAPDLPIMGFYARRLVHCGCEWDEDELMCLSRALVWRASERGENPTEPLAAFASQVYQVFHVAPWTGVDENFRRCLWDAVRETFMSSWYSEEQQTSGRTITYIKKPSPGHLKYVVSALSICSFIGDLFRYKFINRPDTVSCIRILMQNLATVEHVTAISNIIKHAEVPLWRESLNLDVEVQEFGKVLLEKSKPLKDFRTVLLQRIVGSARVRSKVDDILGYVEDCRLVVVDERKAVAVELE